MASKPEMTYEGMLAETVYFPGHNGDTVGAYMARPLDSGKHPGVIVIHEVFGLVEHTKELARKFAAHGYIAIAPDLYFRYGPGVLEEVVASVRQKGGVPDAQVIGDLEGAVKAISSVVNYNGKAGCIGYCSGGRQTLLFACNTKSLAAAIPCYPGRIITDELRPTQPKAVIDMIPDLSCPVLTLSGESDQNPSPEHIARLETELKKYKKEYEIQLYPADTGHGFFADYRPSYRQAAAVDGWQRIFDFFGRNLA